MKDCTKHFTCRNWDHETQKCKIGKELKIKPEDDKLGLCKHKTIGISFTRK